MRKHGVARYAIVPTGPVEPSAIASFDRWIQEGQHGSMAYMERYGDVRANPALLLEGASSMICCAIPYPSPLHLPPRKASIAAYALGSDYHEVVREKLTAVAKEIEKTMGGKTRVCVDTAPLRERYWAQRSGLGFTGLNSHLIIPGMGSFFFLGEILTTALLPPTPAAPERDCGRCGRCVKACPTGAIGPDGTFDARRCLSYLTIEHRGEFEPGTSLHGRLYGCDICGAVCPHNAGAGRQEILPELQPRPALLSLTVDEAASMTQERFSALFTHSAIKRTKLAGLRRNAAAIMK